MFWGNYQSSNGSHPQVKLVGGKTAAIMLPKSAEVAVNQHGVGRQTMDSTNTCYGATLDPLDYRSEILHSLSHIHVWLNVFVWGKCKKGGVEHEKWPSGGDGQHKSGGYEHSDVPQRKTKTMTCITRTTTGISGVVLISDFKWIVNHNTKYVADIKRVLHNQLILPDINLIQGCTP